MRGCSQSVLAQFVLQVCLSGSEGWDPLWVVKELSLSEGSLALLLRGDGPAKRSQPPFFTLPILTASSPHDVLPIILNLALLHACSPLLGDSGAWFGSPSLQQQLEVLELNPLCGCPYSWVMMMKEREMNIWRRV